MINFDLEVDASGLNCPLPLLRLKKGLNELDSGKVIMLVTTDPAAHLDIGVFSHQSGHEILNNIKEDEKQIFYIQKK